MRPPEMQGNRYDCNRFMLTLSNAAMHVKKSATLGCKEAKRQGVTDARKQGENSRIGSLANFGK
ncbi:MAG TPA: hypothetical protein VGR36_06630 [Candidatus Acidoferrales bacterium]|nr:hypothetical protein [Candidatus Acidoferrales bacterium]